MRDVWYFAYGANMESGTLRGRRGVAFRRPTPARLPGWRLVLDKPSILPIQEAFANIIPAPSSSVLGVLFRVTLEDFQHIELTEGVSLGNYDRIEAEAFPLNGDSAPYRCLSLSSEKRDSARRPSATYMGLLIAGATEHGLPLEYVDSLRSVPTCQESAEAAELRRFLGKLRRPGS